MAGAATAGLGAAALGLVGRVHGDDETADVASILVDEGGTPTPADPTEVTFSKSGYTTLGEWSATATTSHNRWHPGDSIRLQASLTVSDQHLAAYHPARVKLEAVALLATAERTFDADGWLRLASDEKMSTLLTPTGLGIEGGVQGAVTNRFGYQFRTPVDELETVPIGAAQKSEQQNRFDFDVRAKLPVDLPPGIYRLRLDFGVLANKRYYSLNAEPFARRPFSIGRDCESEMYSPPIPASGKDVGGRSVDATRINPRIPWVILGNYNSNGYRGVAAAEDRDRFALSPRNIIPDEAILPMYGEANPKNVLAYTLEPQFPADTIDSRINIPWDYSRGELSIQITQPDGTAVDLGSAPFVAKAGAGATTQRTAFTAWKPPMYGQYRATVKGWIADLWGNRYEGGGTYSFWIAKRMTLATATFQGQPYPVGNRYGRDIGFAPAVPADVDVTATLFVNSDPNRVRTISFSGKASAAGMFTAAQGMKPLSFDAPGEYHARLLARYTDADGHLWVEAMRHAGVIYPEDTPIVAHGKKVKVNDKLLDRGETRFEGWTDRETGEQHLDHINFPYNAGDVLLIASEYTGSNKIEPVLSWDYRDKPMGYDPSIQNIGITNVTLRTSNGYSPHLFPEYITDWMYYYAAGPRPGLMGRFLVAESGTRAPYWPTSNTNFGGQINASSNGDSPGDIYRFIGGVVVRKQNQEPLYAGYMATGFILPRGSNNNRVVAPGSEEIMGSTGARARFFLAMNARPGIVYDTAATFAPAFQIDPMLPVNMKFTLAYPDGRTVVAAGVADATGSWAGKERWALDVPGVYRYTLESEWNGNTGLVPGLPKDGGMIFVTEKDRPAQAPGITLNLPPLTRFDPAKGVKLIGNSTAPEVRYAMVIPGAVLGQGTLPVSNGKFDFTLDPAALHEIAQTYDTTNQVSGKPELADVVHLTFFAREALPAPYHAFARLIIRGNTVHYARNKPDTASPT